MRLRIQTCLTSTVWTCALMLAVSPSAFAQTPGEPVIYLIDPHKSGPT
jgi:hypothetical protein